MANLFNSENYATTEPTEIVNGDLLAWKRLDLAGDYKNSEYTLKYVLRLQNSGNEEVVISAANSGSHYEVVVASSVTASYEIGRYNYQAYITKTNTLQRLTIKSGEILVIANRDTSNVNPIDHIRKRLENLEEAILTLSSKTSSSYSIAGRSMTYVDLPQLIQMRDMAQAEISVKTRGGFGLRS